MKIVTFKNALKARLSLCLFLVILILGSCRKESNVVKIRLADSPINIIFDLPVEYDTLYSYKKITCYRCGAKISQRISIKGLDPVSELGEFQPPENFRNKIDQITIYHYPWDCNYMTIDDKLFGLPFYKDMATKNGEKVVENKIIDICGFETLYLEKYLINKKPFDFLNIPDKMIEVFVQVGDYFIVLNFECANYNCTKAIEKYKNIIKNMKIHRI